MPSVFGKETKKKELIKNLDQIYGQIQREHQVKYLFRFGKTAFGEGADPFSNLRANY